jgi:ABC-type multidrug transport system fused ATPase/permease subunit
MILVKVVVSFQAQLVVGLEQLTEMYGTINNGLSLLEHSNEIEDCETAKNIQNISGRIEFKNINFKYNNKLN